PVGQADSLVATRNTPITYSAASLLGNDTDVEGSPLVIGSVASGSNGTTVLNADGSVTFTPNGGYAGPASFTYRASDGSALSAATTVSITVNTLPVANADTVTTPEDTAITIAAS